jgi:hypothetical protein
MFNAIIFAFFSMEVFVAKKNYSEWPKEDLVARLEKLEKRKKYERVWSEVHALKDAYEMEP